MKKEDDVERKIQQQNYGAHAVPQSESWFLRHIEQEHEDIISYLESFKSTTGETNLINIFAKFRNMILSHTQAEEELFYPILIDLGFNDVAGRGKGEHKKIHNLLSKMESFGFQGSEHRLFLEEIEGLLISHIAEEEENLFTIVRDNFTSDELSNLDRRYRNYRDYQQRIAS